MKTFLPLCTFAPVRLLLSVTATLCFALLCVIGGTSLMAQAAATSQNCSLDVVEAAGGSTTSSVKQVDAGWGSTTSDKSATRQLTVTLRNMAPQPGDFTVEWYFVGKSIKNGAKYCYDKGSKPVSLRAGAFQDVVVESKPLESHTFRAGWDGHSNQSGDKPDGWIVRVKVGADVVASKTSNAQLDQLQSDKDAFDRFLAANPHKEN